MTVAACQSGTAQLTVAVDGQPSTYAGVIDADDFAFSVPDGAGFTLADGSPKPTVSGSTFTVRKTKLVGILTDDTVTADGSVTCP